MKKQISILGCGWLGFPLAQHLIQNGWQVKGSTTTSSKLAELKSAEILPYLIELQENQVKGDVEGFLEGSQLLIINIPPGLRKDPRSNFTSKVKALIAEISKSSIEKILYVSSTGVFKDHESIPTFTEHYHFTEQERKTNQLVESEQLIFNMKGVLSSVIRFGGLVGQQRHPVHYLSGKSDLKNPEAPVNLIHLDNCILLISEIIQQEKFAMVFHGVEATSLSKADYYAAKAEELQVKAPKFDNDHISRGKKISTEWTLQQLGIRLPVKV